MKNAMTQMLASFAPLFDVAGAGGGGSAAVAAPPAEGGQPPAGAPPANSPSPSEGGQPAAAAAASPEPTLEILVNGKVEKLTLAEAKELAQQGRDYTRKTQNLADDRKRWDADRQAILQQERAKWHQEQQELARRQSEEGLEPADRALASAQETASRTEDYLLSNTLAQVRAKYPDVDEQMLIIEGQRRGIRTPDQFHQLEAVAAEMDKANSGRFDERFNARFDETLKKGEDPRVKSYKDAIIAEYLKSKGSGPAPVSGSGGAPALSGKKTAANLNEASDMAIERLTAKA